MKKIFDGKISVKSVLESDRRNVTHIYMDREKKNRDFVYIRHLAQKKSIPVTLCQRRQLNEIVGHEKHGGIAAETGARKRCNVSDLKEGPLIYLNGVEDPYNFGSICRTLYAMGMNQLVTLQRDWKDSESIVQKASAGAYEKMDWIQIETDRVLVQYCRQHRIPIYCAHRNHAISLKDMDWPENFCLAVGGALRGLSAEIVAASEQNVLIPYQNDFRNALDTPGAISIFAYEIQRRKL